MMANNSADHPAEHPVKHPAEHPAEHPARLRITSPADLLSYIPHLLGFLPAESLVVLTLSAGRLGATLRVDLPRPGTDPRTFAGQVASFLRPDAGADSAVVVLYTDAAWPVPDRPPYRRLVRELRRSLEAGGFRLRDGWVVSSSVWRNYFCKDAGCCPFPGRPVAEIADSRLSAELIYGGSRFFSSAETAVEPDLVPGPDLAAKRRAVEFLAARYRSCCQGQWTTVPQFRAVLGAWEAVICAGGSDPPDREPETAAFLLASLGSKAVRDSVLVLAALGRGPAERGAAASNLLARRDPGRRPVVPRWVGAAAAGAQPAALAPEPADAGRYSDLLAGISERSPQWDRLDAAYSLLVRLAAVASGEEAAAVHSMLAWIEFARGRGSRASVYLARAERARPGYRLAGLLKELIDRGGMPAWALYPETAWTSGGRSPL